MAARDFPFPAGSPADEIAFLLDFANGDWREVRSDSMMEVVLYVAASATDNGRRGPRLAC